MHMSSACTAPVQPSISDDDRNHPLFNEYQRYRNAMSSQLVSCPSFSSWMYQREESIKADVLNKHPRVNEWRFWLRANLIHKAGYPLESFNHWLEHDGVK